MRTLARWAGASAMCVALAGCSDDGFTGGFPSGGGDDVAADVPTARDTGREVGVPDVTPTDTAPDSASDTAPTCPLGDRGCEDERNRRVCTEEGWQVFGCGVGEVCEAGNCVQPGGGPCVDGRTSCDGREAQVCASGEWVGVETCEAGCFAGTCTSSACATAAASRSYLGCDYYAVPLPNAAWAPFGGTPDAPLGVVVTNASSTEWVAASVFESDGETLATLVDEVTIAVGISAPGETPATISSRILNSRGEATGEPLAVADGARIPPGGLGVFLLDHGSPAATTSVRPDAYRIVTDGPVAAVQFGPYCCNYSFSNDASLLFPVSAWGDAYRFIGVPSWTDPGGESTLPATLSVIGSQPATTVDVELPSGATILAPQGAHVTQTGSSVQAVLGDGEVLTVTATPGGETDLSGATVRADAPVALFSGHECTFVPSSQGACDHVEEQLMPVDTWGSQFALVPPLLRTRSPDTASETTYWKLVADTDGTRIDLGAPWASLSTRRPSFNSVPDCNSFLEGAASIVLDAGEHCEFGTRQAVTISSSAPILVLGVMSGSDSVGFGATEAGDPAVFMVPPRRQFRSSYAFLAPTTYAQDYVTVVAPAGATLVLDGQALDMSGAESVAGSTDRYVHVPIDDGAHRLAGDRPFGILAYAYDNWVSYAFTGGLNLVKQ